MASEDRFKSNVVATLGKRAANRCSNPDCTATTSGPASDPARSVNVGYAAHIYGANPGSARYDPEMASAERGSIANAIWLCGNCHKMIDDDPERFPAGLLFEWQREHERLISSEVGKAGAALRDRYERRHLEEFGKLSYLAERIVLEKGGAWEYRLTAEMLRFEMAPVLQRWDALKRGAYTKRTTRIDIDEFHSWMRNRLADHRLIVGALDQLMNVDFSRSWGAPGVPGDERDIISTCRLFAEMCGSALDWEEQVRFTNVDDNLEEVRSLYVGIGGYLIEEATKVLDYMKQFLDGEVKSGHYQLSLVLNLPDGWVEAVALAYDKATKAILRERA